MKNKFNSGIIVLVCLILIVTGVSLFNYVKPARNNQPRVHINYYSTGDSSKTKSDSSKLYKKQFIAALYIEGTIQEENNQYDQQWLLSTIKSLKENDDNTALAIFINSPGGAVYQADEVYAALQDYKTTGKKIYVYQGSMAASGGYYISCAANQIFANRNTLTGSIGVIMGSSFDLTELFDNLGIKSETIHSGKNKNMMNYNEPLTDEQKEIMQSICDECYEQFVSIVANNRGMTYEKAAKLADGKVYTARQALENGLIDRIDTWDGMIDALSVAIDKPGIAVKTYKFQKKLSLMDRMMAKAKDYESAKAAAALGLPVNVINQMNSNPFEPMYLVPSN